MTASEFAKISKRSREALRIEVSVKYDQVAVRRHDHIRIHTKMFFAMTEAQAISQDLAACLRDEDRKPFDDGVRHIVHGCLSSNAVAFHGRIVSGGLPE